MLNIIRQTEGNSVCISLKGRLDSITSSELEKELASVTDGDVSSIRLDLAELDYISTAGLQILLDLARTMDNKGELKFLNVKKDIMEVFEITRFTDILTIE